METLYEATLELHNRKIKCKYYLNKNIEPNQVFTSIRRYENIFWNGYDSYMWAIPVVVLKKARKRRVFCFLIETQYNYYSFDMSKIETKSVKPIGSDKFVHIEFKNCFIVTKNTYGSNWNKFKHDALKWQREYKGVSIHKRHRNEYHKHKNTKEVIEQKRQIKRQAIGTQTSLF